MTPVRIAVALLLASASLMAAGQDLVLTFRSNVDLVAVYVSVRRGGSLVEGLRAQDFELKDNGVVQEVQTVSSDAVPIDVTVVVDTSSSVINSLPQFRTDVGRIAERLRPEEQMRLITFDTHVREILPMQAPLQRPPVSEIKLGDATSMNDAVLFALARGRRPDRRHLVFVFTDGYDTSSLIGYGALPEIASRSQGALLHVGLVRPNVPPDARASRQISILAEAALRTGGSLDAPGAKDDLVSSFERAIEAFRKSYVVGFAPKDLKEGWHTLSVTMRGSGSYDVRARQGYYPIAVR